MNELLYDLARLRHYGSMLQELMGELQRAAPQRSEGTDTSGMVRAVLGPDGLAESIKVSSYWKEKLPPASFGAAVAAACQAAMVRRGEEWAEVLTRSGWQERLSRLDSDAAAATAADRNPVPPNPVPPAFRRANGGPPRPPDVLAEEAISALNTAERPLPARPPARGAGRNRSGTLEIVLAHGGQMACRADPRWVVQQSGVQLTEALSSVLAEARTELAAAGPGPASSPAGAEDLLAEAFAVMKDPQSFA